MGVRRQAREAALQALYMCDFLGNWDTGNISFCFDHFGISKAARPYAEDLCLGTIANLANIDSKITCASERWSINRMGRVDRSILRLAAYEILKLKDVPDNVAIDEAIEIAKRFGAEDSPMFINGVLDRIASNLSRQVEVSAAETAAEPTVEELSEEIPEEPIAVRAGR